MNFHFLSDSDSNEADSIFIDFSKVSINMDRLQCTMWWGYNGKVLDITKKEILETFYENVRKYSA